LNYPGKVLKLKGLTPEESLILIDELLEGEVPCQDADICWVLGFCNGHPL